MANAHLFGSVIAFDLLPAPPLPENTPYLMIGGFDLANNARPKPVWPQTKPNVGGYDFRSVWDTMQDSIFFYPELIDVGTTAAESNHRIRMWHSYLQPLTIQSIAIDGGTGMELTRTKEDGLDLTDPIFANGDAEYNLYVSLNTDSIIDASFTWFFGNGESRVTRVTGLRAVIFPFIPQGNFVETLEWATAITRTKQDEERFSIRDLPREEVEFNFQLSPKEYARFKTLALGWSPQPFALPLWMEVSRIGNVSAGTDTVIVNTDLTRYQVDGMVALWDTNEFSQVGIITDLQSDRITFEPPLAENRSNLYVAPIKLVDTYQGARATRTTTDWVELNAVFYLHEDDREWSNAFPSWRNDPVLNWRPLNEGGFAEDHYQEYAMFDYTTGVVDGVPDYDYTQFDRTMTFPLETLEQLWTMRNFVGYCRGRYNQFWVPSWNNDLNLVRAVGSADTELVVEYIELARYRNAGNLMVKLRSGQEIYAQAIDAYQNAEGYDVIVLQAPIGTSFAPADVEIICELLMSRLDTDRVEFSYERRGKSQVTVPIKALPTGEI
ncbi:tail assembly protein [Vibrio phage VpKK5]|uniref:tail assembly protein n=1 Tax=Vibrio phage VpKK5 TaxID=1538804 RepID=UPI0004F83AE4|nr:tail assembly protein [Vibrio phage VpKK5]AIM40628.1 tail assembly protein [Vibrio phage VpKK5]